MSGYTLATDVTSAVAALAGGARAVAGGTDLVVGARSGKKPLPEQIVGIHKIPGLADVTENDGVIAIGALVSHAAILESEVLRGRVPGLLDAAAIVGSHATRANGTLGGNVMNASPAMDTGAPLLCHGAMAVLTGPGGTRRVSLDDLWKGPGTTTAAPDELLEAIEVPAPPDRSGSAYVRLQYRRQMEIAVVGVGAYVELDAEGVVQVARIAITALAPVIKRVPEAEAALIGRPLVPKGTSESPSSALWDQRAAAAAREAGEAVAAAATPISDVRGSAGYRTAMAAVMTRRAIEAAARRAGGQQVSVPASDWSVAPMEGQQG